MELNELYALMEKFEKSGLSELVFKRSGGRDLPEKGPDGSRPVGRSCSRDPCPA